MMSNVLVTVCVLINIRTVNKFKFCARSADFVLDQKCKMQNSKSPGLDHFNVRLLKLAGPFISNCLAHICNLSLGESTFPDEWKKAKVTPIFTSSDKTDVGNYKHISVLPIDVQLYVYLTNAGILSNAQPINIGIPQSSVLGPYFLLFL